MRTEVIIRELSEKLICSLTIFYI